MARGGTSLAGHVDRGRPSRSPPPGQRAGDSGAGDVTLDGTRSYDVRLGRARRGCRCPRRRPHGPDHAPGRVGAGPVRSADVAVSGVRAARPAAAARPSAGALCRRRHARRRPPAGPARSRRPTAWPAGAAVALRVVRRVAAGARGRPAPDPRRARLGARRAAAARHAPPSAPLDRLTGPGRPGGPARRPTPAPRYAPPRAPCRATWSPAAASIPAGRRGPTAGTSARPSSSTGTAWAGGCHPAPATLVEIAYAPPDARPAGRRRQRRSGRAVRAARGRSRPAAPPAAQLLRLIRRRAPAAGAVTAVAGARRRPVALRLREREEADGRR